MSYGIVETADRQRLDDYTVECWGTAEDEDGVEFPAHWVEVAGEVDQMSVEVDPDA